MASLDRVYESRIPITVKTIATSPPIYRYDITCPNCKKRATPLVNDGGSIAMCGKCSYKFKGKKVYHPK
jgi:ribosomal protein L37AE/L43A